MREANSISILWFLFSGLILMAGCDNSFQPLKENNLYNFNISGYLDVSADTQWVRVGTIRESIDEPPDPTGIQVTLEDLQSGQTVIMNDSVFISQNALNYWTTMQIQHGQTYLITTEGINKNTSQVTVTTPKEFPAVYMTISDVDGRSPGANIYIDDDVEHIADVQSVWYVIVNPNTNVQRRRIYRFPLRNTLKHTTAFRGSSYAFSNWGRELAQIDQSVGQVEASIVSRRVFIATSGPDWNENFSSFDNLEYFLNETASNVENGLGYVVGIEAKWFLQTDCLSPDESGYIPCEPIEPIWW